MALDGPLCGTRRADMPQNGWELDRYRRPLASREIFIGFTGQHTALREQASCLASGCPQPIHDQRRRSFQGPKRVRISDSTTERTHIFGSDADAEIVVAPHGAGLANMMFVPTDCVLLEIVSEPIANMNDLQVISQVLGQSVVTVSRQSFNLYAGATNPAAQHDFTVDVAELISTVEGNLPG